MSLTDPGDGHVLGTTRFSDWMKGAIVHVEHLERPRHLPREKIESYRIPSILDFSRVRLHVGSSAPTTYFVGRVVKDSGNFQDDFLKVVNLTAAAASAAFFLGAAECKVSMEGLSTAQSMSYMKALRAQVQRSKKQFLSAAWNLNQVLHDDFDHKEPVELSKRMEIAMRAIEITSLGGFDKVTWDGASDTYPIQVHHVPADLRGSIDHRARGTPAWTGNILLGGLQVQRDPPRGVRRRRWYRYWWRTGTTLHGLRDRHARALHGGEHPPHIGQS
ncbi:hypothetical protein C0Q70_20268 [Pomacea canaliculata]|uniref:Uncharacterized protein n=1 Tax=Pomacea canaliculata TaxID=400727 RepID=A0A2T7NF12_POMCA|nr:hypothetical protein C0Q70_20268 [Pomacea canaliculata]